MAFGIDDAVAAGLKVIDKFIPDPEAKARAEGDLRSALLAWDQGQLTVNAVEAANPNLWAAGWRPFIGWVCGVSLAWQYVVMPMGLWSAAVFGLDLPTPPRIDDILWQLMFTLLGMGGLRTFEKMKGVAR